MFRIKILLAARNVITDSKAGSLSAIDILEDITVQSFPYIIDKFNILLSLERENTNNNEIEGKVIISLNNATLIEKNETFSFNGKLRKVTVFAATNVVIPSPGKITITVKLDEKTFSEYNLSVNLNPSETSVTDVVS
jgi:hypothetical protein